MQKKKKRKRNKSVQPTYLHIYKKTSPYSNSYLAHKQPLWPWLRDTKEATCINIMQYHLVKEASFICVFFD